MSQIPGFPLGSMSSPPNQQPQQNMPPNMIFAQQQLLAQHQSQRATQGSPPQPQGVPGMSDPEHRRIWHNPGDPAQVNFTQMAQYFRNPGLHPQQGNLQGFPQQIQPPNVNANQPHHLINSNTSQTSFNTMVAQLNPSQLDPAFRQFVQQQQLRQHAQQQQSQNAGNMAASYNELAFPSNTSHPVNSNAPAALTPDIARQYDLISLASQNQGQNGNSMSLNPGNPLTRSGQVQAMGQQGLSFQQTTNMQAPPNMVPHQSVVSHQNPVTMAAQQIHMNRQMYPPGNSADPNNTGATGSNSGGNTLNNPLLSRVPMPNATQSTGPATVSAMNAMNPHRRLEIQLAALQQELHKHEKMLSDIGWRPGMATTTDQQRHLVAEYEQKKNTFAQYRNIAAQMPSQLNMHANGPNSQSTPNNHLVHGWQPGQASKQSNAQPNVNLQQVTPRMTNGGPASQQTLIPGASTSFPQQTAVPQQSQAMFTPMQQQSSLPVPRTASAQSMNNVMQQVQQQQRPSTASGPGSMFDAQQGQSANGQAVRPPTVPPQPGAVNAPQANPPPIRTPMQQNVPCNVPPRPSPNGDNPNPRKTEFDSNLKIILDRQGVTINSGDLYIDTREVQLHELFTEVMRRGASPAVSQNDLWSIIGANLGFVQFPGTGSDPARSSPAIAEHLKYLYGKYLLAYEHLHLNQLNQERRRQLSQQQLIVQQQQQAQRHPNGGFPFISNPAMAMHARDHQSAEAQVQQQQTGQNVAPQHVIQSPFHATQPGQVQPHLNLRVNSYSQLAHMSVEDLRKLGIPENNIAIIEQHRPVLQRQQHMLNQLQQRGPTQTQQGQMSQMNFAMPPNMRSNIPGPVGGTADGSQMHPGNVMQLSQQIQHNPQGQTTHQQMPPQIPNIPQVYTRPTPAQVHSAREFIRRAVAEQTNKLKRQPQIMRDMERSIYIHSFKPLYDGVVDMEKKLVMFHALFQDAPSTQKLITIIITAKEQNRLLAGSNQFILPLSAITRLITELRMLSERLQQALVKLPPQASVPASDIPPSNAPSNPPNPPPPALVNQTPVVHPQAPNEASSLPQTQVPQAVQNAQLQAQADVARVQPVQHPQQNLQVPTQTQPISKSKRPPTGGVANTPSPAAPATPFNNAPTPPASSSPRTPKSPPKKPSQATPNTNAAASATNTTPVATSKSKPTLLNRRSSKAGQNPAVVLPAAPTFEETKAGVKRSREEDSSTGARPISQIEPAAKKIKTEDWDGSRSDEVEKRQQELSNLQTNQDAQNFLARAADDILIAGAVAEAPTNAGEDIPIALQDLLSSAPSFGIADSFHMSAFVDPTKFGDLSPNTENGVDNFLDSLFDFSKCATEDPIPSSSKLEPPELLHTNLSPESAAETPKHENASINGKHRDNAIKIVDDSVTHNPLERSLWTELNNGEAAFYEHTNFKFDCELPAQGSPWAISGGA